MLRKLGRNFIKNQRSASFVRKTNKNLSKNMGHMGDFGQILDTID